MINLFKKKISKKWVALTTLVLGLFWKVGTANAVVQGAAVVVGIAAADWVASKIFGVSISGWTLNLVVGGLMALVINLVGLVLTVMVGILFQAATYTDFITAPVVIGGWVVIRDLSNMFFILILLIIAFATILRIESYSWKKNLPKLLIMAVLINFSKTLCGLAIDFGQVIMLTFLNAFRATGPAYLFTTFGVEKMFSISKAENKDIVESFSNLTAMLLGLIMLIITGIVVGVFTIILVYRIVMLWILIILSPLAFLAMAIPAGAKYASQWSGEFAKNIITGPVLAFFLWLALVYGSTSNIDVNLSTNKNFTTANATINEMGEHNNLQRFIIAIALLVGGMTMAQQVGGAGSSLAGGAVSKIKSAGAFVGTAPWKVGKMGFFKAGRMADTLQMKGQGAIAKLISKTTGGYLGEEYQAKSLNYRMIKEGWEKNQASKMRDYEGTKAGAWRDQFNRTLSASIGIPIVSQIMRKKSEIKIIEYENYRGKEQSSLDKDKEKLKQAIPGGSEAVELGESIKVREDRIKDLDKKIRSETKKSQQAWTLGKLPVQKYARLQEQEKANEEYTNIKKEDLDERGLVHNYDTEGRIDKKRAYLMHLADINGINTLFDAKGIEMTAENISKFFKSEFGEAAGDVAAEVSRRAEAVGNYKMMGFQKFDVTQGKNILASIDEQKAYAMKKDKERYAQAHARTTHFDSLVDRTEAGPRLSEIGVQQLLHIASSTGRMHEIKNGNYQTRYGEMVVKIEADITNKADEFAAAGREADAAGLRKVLAAFKENYDILGKKEKKESDKEDKSSSD